MFLNSFDFLRLTYNEYITCRNIHTDENRKFAKRGTIFWYYLYLETIFVVKNRGKKKKKKKKKKREFRGIPEYNLGKSRCLEDTVRGGFCLFCFVYVPNCFSPRLLALMTFTRSLRSLRAVDRGVDPSINCNKIHMYQNL